MNSCFRTNLFKLLFRNKSTCSRFIDTLIDHYLITDNRCCTKSLFCDNKNTQKTKAHFHSIFHYLSCYCVFLYWCIKFKIISSIINQMLIKNRCISSNKTNDFETMIHTIGCQKYSYVLVNILIHLILCKIVFIPFKPFYFH